MRKFFLVASALALLAVVLQFYFAGVGAFHRPFDRDGFMPHVINAGVVMFTALLSCIAAAVARAGRGTTWLAALPLVLVMLQYGIFALAALFLPAGTPLDSNGVPLVAEGLPNYVVALHVINGLGILWISVVVFRRARRLAASTPAAAAAPQSVPVAGA
jgi:Family of unknown function (DUF6220)